MIYMKQQIDSIPEAETTYISYFYLTEFVGFTGHYLFNKLDDCSEIPHHSGTYFRYLTRVYMLKSLNDKRICSIRLTNCKQNDTVGYLESVQGRVIQSFLLHGFPQITLKSNFHFRPQQNYLW